jgi:hypothetical protein
VWERCVAVPPGVACQDEAGRLWDVLYLLRLAIGRSDGGPVLRFGVHVRKDNRERMPPLVRLKAVCGPGTRASPWLRSCSLPRTDDAPESGRGTVSTPSPSPGGHGIAADSRAAAPPRPGNAGRGASP